MPPLEWPGWILELAEQKKSASLSSDCQDYICMLKCAGILLIGGALSLTAVMVHMG